MTVAFTCADVALFIRVILHFSPTYLSASQLSRTQQRLLTCGRMKPTPSVMRKLNLTPTEGGYLWHLN